MMSDAELDNLLATSQRVLRTIVDKLALSPAAADRQLALMQMAFPEWRLFHQANGLNQVSWCAALRFSVTTTMRQAGVARRVRCTSAHRLGEVLLRQLELFDRIREAG
ncbi:hypothetical protein [Nonomuraea sp. KM90]|uniref:hypothetical protein n=1 Tax=Nonomuraea sp. KM90 TaxID=3457428 RepID=UPI003FCE729E